MTEPLRRKDFDNKLTASRRLLEGLTDISPHADQPMVEMSFAKTELALLEAVSINEVVCGELDDESKDLFMSLIVRLSAANQVLEESVRQ